MAYNLPNGLISYGPNTNCTLELCDVTWSTLEYAPSLVASGIFIALFGITLILHIAQGFYYQSWWFTGCMIAGCLDEIIGYGGRIILHTDPFSFQGFLMQISTCIPHLCDV